ncbi:hypothetical protein, partial [Novipirellula sp.]|uniref:hypothetical protein n=1 Tax=Novipirellula sp. TaxID=2795430 RepID=UPI00356413A3
MFAIKDEIAKRQRQPANGSRPNGDRNIFAVARTLVENKKGGRSIHEPNGKRSRQKNGWQKYWKAGTWRFIFLPHMFLPTFASFSETPAATA